MYCQEAVSVAENTLEEEAMTAYVIKNKNIANVKRPGEGQHCECDDVLYVNFNPFLFSLKFLQLPVQELEYTIITVEKSFW